MTNQKQKDGKPPWKLLPWDAALEVVKVLAFGATKYSPRGWEGGIAYSDLFEATLRHLTKWFQNREENDPETKLSHLAHAATNCLFLLAYTLRGMKGFDDRPKLEPDRQVKIDFPVELTTEQEAPAVVASREDACAHMRGWGLNNNGRRVCITCGKCKTCVFVEGVCEECDRVFT